MFYYLAELCHRLSQQRSPLLDRRRNHLLHQEFFFCLADCRRSSCIAIAIV
ncbi:MAG: hypothetical protein AAFO95_21960 [Cyanobacteria bacterium J06600_6]